MQLVFQGLLREYRTIPSSSPTGPADGQLRQSIQKLMEESEHRKLSWLELYDFESMLVRLRDDEGLRRSAWSIRREVRQLASEDLWKDYLASKPPDPTDPKIPTESIRRDVEDLLRKLHELRIGRSLLEVIRGYTTSITIAACIILIILAVADTLYTVAKLNGPPQAPSLGADSPKLLFLAMAAGVFGAAFSMLIRLGQIPTKGDLIPRYPSSARRIVWILTPIASLVEGIIAALILYFLLRSELITGELFPKFVDRTPGTGLHVNAALLLARTESALDASKLLVWCFVAGFSERLVPDMLSRLADQAAKASPGNATDGKPS